MKKGHLLSIYFFSIAMVVSIASGATADTLQGSPGAGWQSFLASDLSETGSPFWANTSWDGDQKNIGYYITHKGAFATPSPYYGPGAYLDWWGINHTSTGYDTSFSFHTDSDHSNAAMKLEIAGYAPNNVFGWYDTATGQILQENVIFWGSDSQGAAATFKPTQDYGFFLIPNYSGDWLNKVVFTTGQSGDHFVVFKEPSSTSADPWWIGIEDLSLGDKDYNDMIVKITNVPVPEPTTILLLGLGLVGLAGARRKFKS